MLFYTTIVLLCVCSFDFSIATAVNNSTDSISNPDSKRGELNSENNSENEELPPWLIFAQIFTDRLDTSEDLLLEIKELFLDNQNHINNIYQHISEIKEQISKCSHVKVVETRIPTQDSTTEAIPTNEADTNDEEPTTSSATTTSKEDEILKEGKGDEKISRLHPRILKIREKVNAILKRLKEENRKSANRNLSRSPTN